MALFWRVWAVVVVVNVLVLAFFVGLATLRYASIDAALVGERLAVLANRTATPFAAAARIGLSLQAVRNAPAILERARQTDEAIVAIHVFDAEGRVVHSTAPAAPARIPPSAAVALAAAAGRPWYRETEDGFLSGIQIQSASGAPMGGVLIVYPRRASLTNLRAMGAELAVAAVAVLVVSSALGVVLLRLGLAPHLAVFRAVDQSIAAFERRSWRQAFVTVAERGELADASTPAAGQEVPGDDGLAALLADAERRYLDARRALAAADEERS
ncbi:hypothetical protein [Thauera sp. WH-1]|uniref:hypothetical protein n=1 Tax=Thauera sp. WH-1 TaxID=3398230 RepID=UPI0039FCB3AD